VIGHFNSHNKHVFAPKYACTMLSDSGIYGNEKVVNKHVCALNACMHSVVRFRDLWKQKSCQ